ncbi:hypothetical protein LF1_16840 [Rubripirellula obstinata]|uniref:Uncharacterized protein n=1 Tax=Rubripirellula obstinata TaxID=406547 RepID=A0A5B1CF24_9BACT|nr:hypothetical protein LF1_16840 [Rubripirellula obstinata]
MRAKVEQNPENFFSATCEISHSWRCDLLKPETRGLPATCPSPRRVSKLFNRVGIAPRVRAEPNARGEM